MKKLAVYDYDGTLMSTPEPNPGKEIWKKKTGQEYPHVGWWGRRESLNIDVFDIKPFPNILSKLNKDNVDPNTYTIILTSRIEKLRPELENILNRNNIHVDEVILKRGNEDKGDVIMKYVNNNPDIEQIDVYDDFDGGMDHKIQEFMKIKNQLPEKIDYNIFCVNNDKINIVETTNYLLRIIIDEIQKFKK